jgi:uncharacterized protein (DUF1697 family)
MNTYLALLRGINVGGRNKLPMKELTAVLSSLGCSNVNTYIQSGNVVFRGSTETANRVSREAAAEIRKRHGFEPYILILEMNDLEKAIVSNPYPEAETVPKSLHVGFLESAPANPNLDKMEAVRAETERFSLLDRFFYLHAPDGVGRSKLAARAERHIGVPMTSRNWRTILKLREIARELAG